MADRRAKGRGPHPLPLFLSLATRVAGNEPDRLQAFLEGLKRYQTAPPAMPMPALDEIGRIGGVRLLRVGGAGKPLVIVPSLINAPAVLDLAPGRSLVRFLAGQGHAVFLLDWGPMAASERRLGLAGLVSARLLPLLRRFDAPVRLMGYCLGGTLAIAAGQLLGERLERLALLAAPWHYGGFGEDARERAQEIWRAIEPVGQSLGAVPVSLLNPMFWALDEEAVVRKFEALSRRPEGDPHLGWFASVEDWANSGAPLTMPAARDLFVKAFGRDLMGAGRWVVRGERISPDAIRAPVLDIGALRDRIVPPEARIRTAGTDRRDVDSGHVGMVVGNGAQASLWEPLSLWLHGFQTDTAGRRGAAKRA
ncbi:alpha/beta hydrolase [Sandaracinobacteroides hominis]|uniref:alpha/beta hydrolase n=1 Tax=Sandaracinobacteroides hominis TaxID=2780086 RepID=UPI0018F686BB|nr:alpha/beta hydrolase [Sandaracinobacteroides hominis]